MGALAAAWVDSPAVGILLSAIVGGGLVAILRARPDNRKTNTETAVLVVDRQRTLDDMQADILANVRKDYGDMASRLDKAITDLSEERRKGAEKDLKIEVLERRLEQQHDQIVALRAQLGLVERRDSVSDPEVQPDP